MKETLYSFVSEFALVLAVLAFFMCFTLFWLAVANRVKVRMDAYQENFTNQASANAADMFMSIDPQRLFRLNLAALVIIPLLVFILFRDVPTTLIIAGAILFIPGFWYRSAKKRRLREIERQMPDALAMVAGSLRAGASLNIALDKASVIVPSCLIKSCFAI